MSALMVPSSCVSVRAGKVLFSTVRPDILKEESLTTCVRVGMSEDPKPDSVHDCMANNMIAAAMGKRIFLILRSVCCMKLFRRPSA